MVLQNLQTRKSNVSDLWHNLMQGFYLDMVFYWMWGIDIFFILTHILKHIFYMLLTNFVSYCEIY
jgi:hypothetical protein